MRMLDPTVGRYPFSRGGRTKRKDLEEGSDSVGVYTVKTKDIAILEIDTYFGRPYVGGNTSNSQKNYAREAKGPPLSSYIVDSSSQGNQLPPISLTQEDAEGVHFLHYDALVVRAMVARNGL